MPTSELEARVATVEAQLVQLGAFVRRHDALAELVTDLRIEVARDFASLRATLRLLGAVTIVLWPTLSGAILAWATARVAEHAAVANIAAARAP